MASAALPVRRWLRSADTMLGQVRTLYLGIVLALPLFGLWHMFAAPVVPALAGEAAGLLLVGWLYLGYRRGRFPAWSWVGEGACVCLAAGTSGYGVLIGLSLAWIGFRSLYGPLPEKSLAAVVLCALMGFGVLVLDVPLGYALPLLFALLLLLAINHLLASICRIRDGISHRTRIVASAGTGLVAATTRADAMEVTLQAALGMHRAVGSALILTILGRSLRVVAAGGRVGAEVRGRVTKLSGMPAQARDALRPGGYAGVTGAAAAAACEALQMPAHPGLVIAPLTAHGDVFGALVLVLDRSPDDDLRQMLTTLADWTALTLDQLLIRSRLSIVVDNSPDALILAREDGNIRFVNPAAAALLGCAPGDLLGLNLFSLVHGDDVAALRDVQPAATPVVPCRIHGPHDLGWANVEAQVKPVIEHDGSRSLVFTARDVSEQHRLELELRHAQKLESVGRLAAGIAHEINTPIQFVGDNVRFLQTAFADLDRLCAVYRDLAAVVPDPAEAATAVRKAEDVAADIDVEFLMEEVPTAITQTLDGVDRVANIVRAMKAFGHPGMEVKARSDLNEAIRNTLVVAANEIKYVADVEVDYGDLPLVYCHLGDINQVVLNLVVNAAHAITAAQRGRGTIRVRTRLDGGYAVIEVADTGTGVAPEIADKIFDHFFTTKDVGVGTGQGLALVRTLVTDRHGGTIDFTSEVGEGTVFTVRLPVAGNDDPSEHGDRVEAAV
ncbi:ATP-binding protein [Krasilnikovia sp. MM14-A1259]|uniref:ATP-binding protein n=1 Tax=Krasilnikovia sp. MM14-A1259 TaxID=3373539 RepID=UPI003804AB7C